MSISRPQPAAYPPAAALAAALLLSVAAQGEALEGPGGKLIHDEIWGFEILIPGYGPWDDYPQNSPKLILAAEANPGCHLSLSMFAERVREGASADECRRSYYGNPEPLRKRNDVRLHAAEVTPITYSLFDYLLKGGLVNNKLYGYWTRGDHCFELHVSSIGCESFAREAIPILQSVKILGDTGATLETVALARRSGGDPRDWHLHVGAAGKLLHEIDPPETELARRLYGTASKLGGAGIDPRNLWLIEEGLGLSWLMEDEGRNARQGIPHLERALDLAKGSHDLAEAIDDSAHNLACALSLSGDTEASCRVARELLTAAPPAQRGAVVKGIRVDPQLKALRKSDCYESLLKELGLR